MPPSHKSPDTAPTSAPAAGPGVGTEDSDLTTRRFFSNSSGRRVHTPCVVLETLHYQYPNLEVVVCPEDRCDLLAFAAAGHATAQLVEDGPSRYPQTLKLKAYIPPARRLDGGQGGLGTRVDWGKFAYEWRGERFIVYLADGRDGTQNWPSLRYFYIVTEKAERADALIVAAGQWAGEMREEVWVYDQGWWDKSRELFESVMKSSWDNVILDEGMKKAIIQDHLTFFASRESYAALKVPWKRGVLYYGPPGNGKTISIKAMMRTLFKLENSVPTLYVRSLSGWAGPEADIASIFGKARELAPCYLVFEDLDTIVTPDVRSYFLNQVDGLSNNDGIFMIGSTNHLDQLDPGISKRPSRFDRKYLFPDPNFDQRVAYCRFWQRKLGKNDDIAFPDRLCPAIAEITDGFSFAYMQEAFVAALLAIARRADGGDGEEDDGEDAGLARTEELDDEWVGVVGVDDEDEDLDGLVLWVEIKKQIEILREGMEEEDR